MKRIIIFLLPACLSLLAAVFLGGATNSLFEQANTAYSKGRHSQAAGLYQAAGREEGLSAELLFSLADSYAADGQTGPAVLNYERALLLAPGDADAATALTELRRKKGLLLKQPLHSRLASLLGADQWMLLSGAAFVLLSLTVLAAGLLGRSRFPQACRLSALFLAATLLPLPLALLRYQEWHQAVIMTDSVLLLSPFAGSEQVAALKAGSLVRPLNKTHGGYALIRDEDGQSGWLEQNCFQQIAVWP